MGTRASQLAMTQSGLVVEMLKAIHPDCEIAIKKIKTQGDRQQKASLTEIGGQGIFVKELEEALLAETIDFAVHSLKDVPTDISDGLGLVAFPERVDPRDVLVSKSGKGLADLPQGSLIGTGSQRRAVQLLARRPDLQTQEIRGNVDTTTCCGGADPTGLARQSCGVSVPRDMSPCREPGYSWDRG
jgi:hydroxymethylbilane synthase